MNDQEQKVSWLVCKENCVKGDAKVGVTLKTGAKSQADNEGEFEKWNEMLPKKTGSGEARYYRLRMHSGAEQFKSASGKLVVKWDKMPEKVEWFPDATEQMMVTSNDLKTENGQSTVTFKVDALPGEKVSDAVFDSVLAYTLDGKRVGLAVPIRLSQEIVPNFRVRRYGMTRDVSNK